MNAKKSTAVWIVASLMWSSLGWAAQSGDWQLAMLKEPSPAQLKMEQRGEHDKAAVAEKLTRLFCNDAMDRIEINARHVLGACCEGDVLMKIGDPKDLEIVVDYLSMDAVKIHCNGQRVQ